MKQVPKEIKEYFSNAQYYLDSAIKLPSQKENAAHIFLLLVAWENLVTARSEISNWARKNMEEIPKDHAKKLDEINKFAGSNCYISRIIIGAPGTGTPAREVKYKTGKELAELRLICQYGSKSDTKNVKEVFKSYWHTDRFRDCLRRQIDWEESWLPAYEGAG